MASTQNDPPSRAIPPTSSPRSSFHPSHQPLTNGHADKDPHSRYSNDSFTSHISRPRLDSISSLTFIPPTLPVLLRSTSTDPTSHPTRHLGVPETSALIIGSIIGAGIFSSPGVIVAEAKSAGASLIVWAVAGVLAWTGACCFAELGTAIPLDGGAQAYLAYAYGPLASYLFFWTQIALIKPGSTAAVCLICGEYINRLIVSLRNTSDPTISPTSLEVSDLSIHLVGVVVVFSLAGLNLVSRKTGAWAQVLITVLKVASIFLILILGLLYYLQNGPGPALRDVSLFEGSSKSLPSYAIALYSGLWAFDGFESSNYVAGQMTNPSRQLPLVIHTSMALVLILYLLANLAYLAILPLDLVASTNTIALAFGGVTIGKAGGVVFSCVVTVSCYGGLNAQFITGAQLIVASAKDSFLPSRFSALSPTRQTPDTAILLYTTMSLLYVLFGGGFRSLVNFFSVASWTFYLVTVGGLLVLRWKEPGLERPYKTYITTPIIFCAVAAFLLLMPIVAAPLQALLAYIFIGLGIPAYYLTARQQDTHKRPPDGRIAHIKDAMQAMFADFLSLFSRRNRDTTTSSGTYETIPMDER